MEMQSSRHIAAPPDMVWEKLNDAEVLKESIHGCESFQPESDGTFLATIRARVGPLAASFKGRVTLSNVVAGRSYTLIFDSKGGLAGSSRGTADVTLEPHDGGTYVRYVVSARVGGGIARVGQPIINRVARRMADDFFARFEEVIVGRPNRQPPAS